MNLTNKQLEIINGSLLGDGTIWTNFVNPTCKFQLTQSTKDKDGVNKKTYLSWWANEFMDLGCSIKPRTIRGGGVVSNNKLYHSYIFTTKCNSLWNKLEKKWYKPIVHPHYKRRKIIPSDLTLTPLTACIWMMEDGSNYCEDGNITLETQGFSQEEVCFLIKRLKNDLGILASEKKTKKEEQYRIFIGVKSFKKFINIIKPHVAWDCFQYKLDDSYNKIPQIGEKHSLAKLTELQARQMILLRKEGRSILELSKIFKISEANASFITSGSRWKHLGEYVKVKRKPRLTTEKKNQIKKLKDQGLSQAKIAKMLNINQSTVSRAT